VNKEPEQGTYCKRGYCRNCIADKVLVGKLASKKGKSAPVLYTLMNEIPAKVLDAAAVRKAHRLMPFADNPGGPWATMPKTDPPAGRGSGAVPTWQSLLEHSPGWPGRDQPTVPEARRGLIRAYF